MCLLSMRESHYVIKSCSVKTVCVCVCVCAHARGNRNNEGKCSSDAVRGKGVCLCVIESQGTHSSYSRV